MQKERPNTLLASQCFFKAYQAQKKVPGIAATTCDLVNSISNAAIKKMKQTNSNRQSEDITRTSKEMFQLKEKESVSF